MSKSYKFKTKNKYQSYKLKPFLDNLGITPTNIYNEQYILSTDYTIEEIVTDYNLYQNTKSNTYYPKQSSIYKIIPKHLNILQGFKENTFIDIGILNKIYGNVISPYIITGDSGRTLIHQVTSEYMIIEKPRIPIFETFEPNHNGDVKPTQNFDIINVSKLQDISDILYELYISNTSLYNKYSHSYYYKYTNNIYNGICSQYALILKSNPIIRNLATGIIYQKDDLFNFDLFDINIDPNFRHLNDINLTFTPIELIDIGVDKKTKLPIPLNINNLDLNKTTELSFLGSTTDGYHLTPESHLYTTTLINGNLYSNVKYQGVLHFNNETTKTQPKYAGLCYSKNTSCLVLDTNNLNQQNLTYNYYFDNIDNENLSKLYDFDIKSDNIGNSYHIGYSTPADSPNNINTYVEFGSPTTSIDNISKINQKTKYTVGHLYKYDTNNQISTAITYHTNGICLVNDLINIDNYQYVLVSADNDYFYRFNNDNKTQFLNDTLNKNKTCTIIKYNEDFKSILWYNKFYGTNMEIVRGLYDINGNEVFSYPQKADIINDYIEDEQSLHLINDNNLYSSINVDVCSNLSCYNGADTINIPLDSNHKAFVINKHKISDGTIIWSKPLYYGFVNDDITINCLLIDYLQNFEINIDGSLCVPLNNFYNSISIIRQAVSDYRTCISNYQCPCKEDDVDTLKIGVFNNLDNIYNYTDNMETAFNSVDEPLNCSMDFISNILECFNGQGGTPCEKIENFDNQIPTISATTSNFFNSYQNISIYPSNSTIKNDLNIKCNEIFSDLNAMLSIYNYYIHDNITCEDLSEGGDGGSKDTLLESFLTHITNMCSSVQDTQELSTEYNDNLLTHIYSQIDLLTHILVPINENINSLIDIINIEIYNYNKFGELSCVIKSTKTNEAYLHKMIYYNNNIYITIRTDGQLVIDDKIYGVNPSNKIFIIKLDNNGNLIWVEKFYTLNNPCFVTDLVIYNGTYGEHLYVSGYYNNSIKIGSYNLVTNNISSFVAKMNLVDGNVTNVIDKQSTDIIKIKSLNVVGDKLYIGGDFKGWTYINGNGVANYKYSENSEIFIEEIKINSF